ncbi:MAG: hypothetical protein K9N46_00370 [Candidatus Marinimicrobia bacterium]|nr:hypothetical protein [Candidatus Neomarinimicrobiota bacterium]MCF7829863.1 hypothetical protein [Candidatus Neomarinimicrobiota bacterium]MCF7879174.1 hypothetical protein [Candidatus Neomarinimicrobiota bacterium]
MKKTQTGWVIIGVIIAVNILVFFNDTQPQVMPLVLFISAAVILLFYNLTIQVTNEAVKFSFGIGLIHGSYAFDKIESCCPKNYIPLGWGIRLRPGVILYNVSGRKALELKLKHKKRKIWLGTDSPEELAEHVNANLPDNK